MNRIISSLIILALILLLPLLIVLVILGLISSILNIPFKIKRRWKLELSIVHHWLKDQKYLYLEYDRSSSLADYVENSLLARYETHIIVDSWSTKGNKWTHNYPDRESRIISIVEDIAHDFDGDVGLRIIPVSKETRFLNIEEGLHFLDMEKGEIDLNGKMISLNQAYHALEETVQTTIKRWEKN